MAKKGADRAQITPTCGQFTGTRSKGGHLCGGKRLPTYDGQTTRHCRFHGGKQEAAPPGDPIRPGRPATSNLYSRLLRGELLAHYEAASADSALDAEIQLLRAKLAWATGKWQESPQGGVPSTVRQVPGPNGVVERVVAVLPFYSIMLQVEAELRKTIATRSQVRGAEGPSAADLVPYEEFLKMAREQEAQAKAAAGQAGKGKN